MLAFDAGPRATLPRGEEPPAAGVLSTSRASDRRLLLVPTLNEEDGIGATLDAFDRVPEFAQGRRPTVLVVDGRSSDRTVEIARHRGTTVLLQQGKGKGRAVRDGLDWAWSQGFTSVGVLDADGTYPVDRLPALFGLLENGVDLVVGVRRPPPVLDGTVRDMVHRVGNSVLNLCAAQFSRRPLLDVCSGFWGLRVAYVPSLALESEGFEVESEIFIKGFRRGLRVVQFPVSYQARIGTAKLHAARDGARILLSIVRHCRAAAAPPTPSPAGEPPRTGPEWTDAQLSALQSTLLTLTPTRVVVAGAPSRRSEANRLAAGLVHLGVAAEVGSAVLPSVAPDMSAARAATTSPGRPSGGTLVVSLPDLSWGPSAPDSIVLDVPRGRRVVLLGNRDRRTLSRGHANSEARRLRPTVRSRGRPGFLAVLGACFDPSGLRKESALLRANVTGLEFGVFRPASAAEASLDAVRDKIPTLRSLRTT